MEAVHGSHCNVRYSRPKRCKFCGRTIVWYSCDHLSVPGLPLDSRDPWIEHKCHRYNLHRWKQDVGATPIGKFITSAMSDDNRQAFDAVIRLNSKLLNQRHDEKSDNRLIVKGIAEHIRLSEVLLELPEDLRGIDIQLPETIMQRRNMLHQQRLQLIRWQSEISRRH